MKFVISAGRNNYNAPWRGYVGRKEVTACPSEVEYLFEDMTRKLACKFEISNVRPRFYDYHTFDLDHDGYKVSEITRGYTPRLTSWVSNCIEEAFRDKGERYGQIYVSIY